MHKHTVKAPDAKRGGSTMNTVLQKVENENGALVFSVFFPIVGVCYSCSSASSRGSSSAAEAAVFLSASLNFSFHFLQ